MIKVLITGHGGSHNRGCEAIVRTTIDIIRRNVGPVDVTILSFNPAMDKKVLQYDLRGVHIPDAFVQKQRRYTLQWLADVLYQRVLRPRLPGIPSYLSYANRSFYREADVVLSVGGDNFSDDYGVPSHFFGELVLARILGSLTVIWGASIGPFRNKKLEKKWSRHLRKIDLITVREKTSLEYLQDIGVTDNVRLVADPAFLLPSKSEGAVNLSSFKEKINVGLGISALVSSYGSDQEKYVRALTAFTQHILSDTNTRLILIPHVIGESTLDSDEVICRRIAGRLPCRDRVTIVDNKHNASQMKHVISQCHYFIGARTHSTIASLSSYIPTLSIAYSRKAYGLNMDLFGHTEYVLPIKDVTQRSLIEKYTLLCNRRPEVVKQLKSYMPIMKDNADRAGIYIREMLCRHGYFKDI